MGQGCHQRVVTVLIGLVIHAHSAVKNVVTALACKYQRKYENINVYDSSCIVACPLVCKAQQMEQIGLKRTMRNKTFPIGRNGYDVPVSASACVELSHKYSALDSMAEVTVRV